MLLGPTPLAPSLLPPPVLPSLLASDASRVVVLSSGGHKFSDVSLDDPSFTHTPYEPWIAYGRAKTANALFANEPDRRHRSDGLHAWSVHPGAIITDLGRHLTEET